MGEKQDTEQELKLAFHDFVLSLGSDKDNIPDFSNLMEITNKLPLSNLDYWERYMRWEYACNLRDVKYPWWERWLNIKEKEIPPLTWLDLIHPDGRRREEALRELRNEIPNAFFFALAIRRLNDWAAPVVNAACDKLPLLAQHSNPIFVVHALVAILPHWASWGRINEASKQTIKNIMSVSEVYDGLIQKIIDSAVGPMPTLMSQLARVPNIDDKLLRIATQAVQPAVRASAYRCILEGKVSWHEGGWHKGPCLDFMYGRYRFIPNMSERSLTKQYVLHDALQKASIDKSPIVRSVSAEMLIRQLDDFGDIAYDMASHFSKDISTSISQRGSFILKMLDDK